MGKLVIGRNGKLRILDNTDSINVLADGAQSNMDVVAYASASYVNETSDAYSNDANYVTLFAASGDAVYIGLKESFSSIRIRIGGGNVLGHSTGCTLNGYYYNGTDWTSTLTLTDNTASGGKTFQSNNSIRFKPPVDWVKGQGGLSDLDTDKYYVKLSTSVVPDTAPVVTQIAPNNPYWFEVIFADMNFDGPIGRALTNEMMVLHRGKTDANMHYIEESDDTIFEPLAITFSCKIDDATNYDNIFDALDCANPNVNDPTNSGYWVGTGTTTKGSTKNDGTNDNPAFADSDKKCVNIQMKFEDYDNDSSICYCYYEVYFPPQEQRITESAEAVTLTCNGYCYGVIEKTGGFGNRF